MQKKLLMLLYVALFASIAFLSPATAEEVGVNKITKLPFGEWYVPVEYKVTPQVKGYALPLPDKALNPFIKALSAVKVSPMEPGLLQNGFIISEGFKSSSVAAFFEHFRNDEIPVFVTADSVLHLYHILFDKILAELEETTFSPYLVEIFTDLANTISSAADEGEQAEAKVLALKYLQVATALLKGETEHPDMQVALELKLIAAHKGFSVSPLFTYEEDYSQYVPRGHYTKNDALKNYFRSMMWLGRMTFLAKGYRTENDNALVSIHIAKVQSLAAAMLATALAKSPTFAKYEAIYKMTSFFVGYSDDLTPYEYCEVLSKVIGENPVQSITAEDTFLKFQAQIALLTPPAIYSGTGNIEVTDLEALKGEPKPEILNRALNKTMGMRLMGQRFVIDSYFTGKLVFPTVGAFVGKGTPFTGVPKRTMPTALDVMSVLGSKQAERILVDYSYSAYKNYLETTRSLQAELAALAPTDWQRNVYMGWLDSLRVLFKENGEGYQPFQKTRLWDRRKLNTALGSWTALRHDTILYVKQSYTLKGMGVAKQPPAIGYVEPEPELFAKLLALHRLMVTGIGKLGLQIPEEVKDRCNTFDILLTQCLDISIAELEAKELTEEQNKFLKGIADIMKRVEGRDLKEFTTEIVADVHTDGDKGNVLEEGTGPMHSLVVVFALPDGKIDVAIGPAYSWYEFTVPMSNRLTDEKWQQILHNSPPMLPTWMLDIMPTGKPLPEERF